MRDARDEHKRRTGVRGDEERVRFRPAAPPAATGVTRRVGLGSAVIVLPYACCAGRKLAFGTVYAMSDVLVKPRT